MKAKYVGDPREDAKPEVPEVFEAFGVTFERGKFVEITDEEAARKIAGNNHFEVRGEAPEADAK